MKSKPHVSHHDALTLQQLRNQLRLTQWQWRWHLQGGSRHIRAHDLQDLRGEADLRRWRPVQYRILKARQLLAYVRRVGRLVERSASRSMLSSLLQPQAG